MGSSRKPKPQDAPPAALHPVLRLTGRLWQGVDVMDEDGKPLRLAVVDQAGKVVEEGDGLSRAVWKAVLNAYLEHLRELGLMRELTEPPAVHQAPGNAAKASISPP
jgi:hypothetical protein